jgi:hypothetical protein
MKSIDTLPSREGIRREISYHFPPPSRRRVRERGYMI